MAGKPGDPEDDLELDPPLPDENEETDLQDEALVESEADEESEQDEIDGEERQVARQPDQPEQRQQQPSRGERRIQTLSNELAEARRREQELNRRLDGLIASQGQPRQQQETPEARAQRMALLTPEERITAELNDAKQSFAREMQVVRFQSADGNDKAAFQAKATVDPLYRKWEPKVEAELQILRGQNMNVERERLMYYLIGKAAVEARHTNGGKQRAEAQRRVSRQQTRPSNSGSDVSQPRRDRSVSLERRLSNVEL